jgi:ABC-type sulfate transport system substrate-binding protein
MLQNIALDYAPDRVTSDIYAYVKYRTNGINRSVWHGEDHSDATRDELSLVVGDPKASGNFRGVRKATVKFTRDQVVPGVDATTELTAPLIVSVSVSIPVGTTAAEVMDALECTRCLLGEQGFVVPALSEGEI